MEEDAPTADLNSTFEVSENEDAEITRSLQASLLVQAPLQVRFMACSAVLAAAEKVVSATVWSIRRHTGSAACKQCLRVHDTDIGYPRDSLCQTQSPVRGD